MTTSKDLSPTFARISEMMKPTKVTLVLANHHLNGREFEITKGTREYRFNSTSTIVKGVQTHKELQFEPDAVIEFVGGPKTLFTKGLHLEQPYWS